MPYLFRCTYCNQEQEIYDLFSTVDENCYGCGEDLCTLCVHWIDLSPYCDSCFADESFEVEEEVEDEPT